MLLKRLILVARDVVETRHAIEQPVESGFDFQERITVVVRAYNSMLERLAANIHRLKLSGHRDAEQELFTHDLRRLRKLATRALATLDPSLELPDELQQLVTAFCQLSQDETWLEYDNGKRGARSFTRGSESTPRTAHLRDWQRDLEQACERRVPSAIVRGACGSQSGVPQ